MQRFQRGSTEKDGWAISDSPVKPAATSGVDYTTGKDGLCWYKMPDFRRLYPEYKDLSNQVLSEKLYAKVGQPLQHIHPWHKVFKTAAIAIGMPVAVLLLGWSLLWALAGFRPALDSGNLK